MKILAIAYDLPPVLRPQAIQIGRLLYNLPEGYRLYVATSDDKTAVRDNGFYSDIGKRFQDTIRLPFKRGLPAKIFTRIFPVLFQAPDIFKYWHGRAYKDIIARWGGEKFDRIVTFSYPFSSSLLGMRLKKFFGVKWIAFLSDPWADNPHFGYRGLSKIVNRYLERKVLENADKIIFTSPETLESYKKKYPFIAAKSGFLEHSYDPSLYGRPEKNNSPAIVIRHIGSFYKKRTVEPVLAALSGLLNKNVPGANRIRFEVIGHSPARLKYEQTDIIKSMGLEGVVKMAPGAPYLESLRLMRSADLLVLVDAPIDGSVYLPSKLIDYIGSGTPILAVTPAGGASSRVVKRVGGWSVDPRDTEKIERALEAILSLYESGSLSKFGPKGDSQSEFSILSAKERFVKILEEV